jgi:AmmeMemoRadiSam system protein A
MLTASERETLLQIARHSIAYGLEYGHAAPVTPADYSKSLQEIKATFVTLTIDHDLRGCIGTLQAHRPLVEDVAENAYAAAFHDPRFPRMSKEELDKLSCHISILSTPEPVKFKDEADLLAQLRPGIDGLVLEEGYFRGTFLPQVWDSLPAPKDFLRHLKLKAGLSPEYWSKTLTVQRYTVEEF